MYAVGRLGSYISRGVYTVSGPFHPFGGAVDIIVVEQPDGSFKSSPWYVRFGKFQGVLKTREKVVSICVNGIDANFHMFLDHKGEAYFLREVDVGEGESESVSFPFSSGDETDEPSSGNRSGNRRPMKSKSCNYDADKSNSVSQVDVSTGKIVARTSSRRSRIFGLVFGQRSAKEDGYQEGDGDDSVMRVSSLERAELAADLLEVKWSTNLASNRSNNNVSRFSCTNDVLDNKHSEDDVQINNEENQFHSSVHGKEENSGVHQTVLDETDVCNEQKVSHSGLENLEDSVEEASMQVSRASTEEQVIETSLVGEGFVEDKCKVIASISGAIDECSVGHSDHDGNETGTQSGMSHPDLQSQHKIDFADENQFHSSLHDKEENSGVQQTLLDEADVCNERKVSHSHPGLENLEFSVEEASIQVSSVSTEELVVETSSIGEGFVEDKCKVIASISGAIDECSVGHSDHDWNETGALLGMSCPDLQSQHKIEGFSNQQFDEEPADSDRNAVLPGYLISNEESVSGGAQSFIYCETSESSVVTLNGSSEQTCETMCLSDIGNGKVHIHTEMLVTATEFVPEVTVLKHAEDMELNSEGALAVSESYSRMVSGDPVIGSVEEMKSHSIHNSATVSDLGDQVEDEKNAKDVLHPSLESVDYSTGASAVSESYSEKANGDPVIGLVEEMKSHSIHTTATVSDLGDQVEDEKNTEDVLHPSLESVDFSKGASAVSESYSEKIGGDPVIGLVEEMKSHSIHNTASVSDLGDQVEGEKNTKDVLHLPLESVDDSRNFRGGSDHKSSVPPSESSEDEQFLFSDLDESKLHDPDCVNKDHHPSTCTENEEVNGLFIANNVSYLNSNNLEQENPSTNWDNTVEKSRLVSHPISISRNHRVPGEKHGWQVESLPIMWSPVAKFDANNNRPLSHSLDSSSETIKWTSIKKDESSCIRSDADVEQPVAHARSSSEDSEASQKLKNAIVNSAVELSLCKHLLYEGMGAEAASQVFDAEKLDNKKFGFLGPTVVKNDRLVVRIGSCYFPWDAAAPILLGMVAFGSEEIFEPKGMIPVDRAEKSIEGDPSKPVVSRSGSWRLWPFSLKRSRSRKAVQPAPADTRGLDAENAADATVVSDDDKNLLKAKQVKKMIRAITPTSEQLASLNLKDGMNHITFTFSTAMLGKQQVDARIYLWKWNTRIVISDVDGTITKSDVLGQFMPLVGMDWSQTGVAHLFSAIKENGYQLLFLSARAISQAYITRQFLVNLKQDGKALPDGPIVISPDGLFPSLYREVIRRAPHEFKIACLEDIKALFPSDSNPFYAGFGNRDTDEISYLKVGIPKGKIFIINPKGEVAVNRRVDTKSYSSLHDLVHGMFPPTASSEQEDFNSWNYWKLPPPLIDM